ncbi:MAG TPA: DUF6531 domain-containing protein, partial [Isosphaeraceae bacterium]
MENGSYHFVLPTTLLDAEGFPLDQNANGLPGEPEDSYSFTLTLDNIPPRVTSHAPTGDFAGTIDRVDVWFSEAIDTATFTTADVAITRPDGQAVTPTGIQEVGLNRFRISFPAQSLLGTYRVRIGPDVRDRAGNRLDQDRDGTAGDPVDDMYDARFNLVAVDLGLSGLGVSPGPLWAGEPVTVSWRGANRTGAPLLGAWTDGVYLSADDRWDVNDVLLATVPHSGGLAENQEYAQTVTVPVPGKLPGHYRILVRADVANQERETNEADNLITSAPLALGVRPLPTDGTPVAGSVAPADRADYFQVHLDAGQSLHLRLDGQTPGQPLELYVRYAALPTRLAYDQRSNTTGATQAIALTGIAGGGTYYVMVHGDRGAAAYALVAQQEPFFVTDVSPRRHAMIELVDPPPPTPSPFNPAPPPAAKVPVPAKASVILTGTGFDETTRVTFRNAQGRVQSVPARLVSASTLVVDIDFAWTLPGDTLPPTSIGTSLPIGPFPTYYWAPGRYAIVVSKQGAADLVLADAFEVLGQGEAKLETNLIVPGAVSPGFPVKQTLWVEYRNTGTVAMPAPLLQVVASGTALLTASAVQADALRGATRASSGLGNSVQVLGIGSGAMPGLLQPGESGRIPIYYLGQSRDLGAGAVTFSLGSLTTRDTTENAWYRDPAKPKNSTGSNGPGSDQGTNGVKFPFTNPPAGFERLVYERPRHGRRDINVHRGLEDGVPAFEEYLTIDWGAVRGSRPETVPADAWDAILLNLRGSYGDLWADYVARMDEIANYLGGIGQPTADLGALWGFEVARASAALSPVRYLAGAVDASAPAPGLPLVFSRVYRQDLVSRFRTGPLGRGWSHNWDVSAQELTPGGDVVLRGPGGVDRSFTRTGTATFTAAPGDSGRLTLTGGAFRLVETDGTAWQFRADGKLASVEDTNGNRITLGYDAAGRLASLTHTSGRQLLLEYNAAGRLARLIDPLGPGAADDRVTSYEYDPSGEHLVRVTAPGNRVTRYDYTPAAALPFHPSGPRGDLGVLFWAPDPRS